MKNKVTVLFACVHNAGRSQIAAALFNSLADPSRAEAISAGTQPAQHVHPEVVATMREIGLDLSKATPRRLTPALAKTVHYLVTMGCGEECPIVPGARREDWMIPDPKGRTLEETRAIRDQIRTCVESFVLARGWQPASVGAERNRSPSGPQVNSM